MRPARPIGGDVCRATDQSCSTALRFTPMLLPTPVFGKFLDLAGRLFQQRHATSAYSFPDCIAEKPHHPRQFDLDTQGIVQHFDPTRELLPHRRCGKVQSVSLPVVIEPTEQCAELARQTVDATVEPTPCLLSANPVGPRRSVDAMSGLMMSSQIPSIILLSYLAGST